MKKLFKKSAALFMSAVMASGTLPAVLAADAGDNEVFATREYTVSEFVQSVGRNNLTGSNYILSTFIDADSIDDLYKEDMAKAVTEGLLQGYDDKTLQPKDNITRVEALTILARCLDEASEPESEQPPIEFTDVPDWAKADIDKLSSSGIVYGYGDGTLGAQDNITIEQVKLLTDRTDELFNTVPVGESFYGYINNKTFRNVTVPSTSVLDAKHGAIITQANAWSAFGDINVSISEKEDELLEKLMNDELTYEKGSAEQRVRDLLLCIQNTSVPTDADKAMMKDLRDKIMGAKSMAQLLEISTNIYNETGINPLFVINSDVDDETNISLPLITFASIGCGGIIDYRKEAAPLKEYYKTAIKEYADACGIETDEKDIENALDVQINMSKGTNYATTIFSGLHIRLQYDKTFDQEKLNKAVEQMLAQHKEIDPQTLSDNDAVNKSYSVDEADEALKTVRPSKILNDSGFTDYEKIIFPNRKNIETESEIFKESNLTALKLNALMNLSITLECPLSDKESAAVDNITNTLGYAMMFCEGDDVSGLIKTVNSLSDDDESDNAKDDNILSADNITLLNRLLPNDIGLIYCDYYYDDETSKEIANLIGDLWKAYIKRFENNTWMEESTKANAIKKIKNMIAIVGYPDNYDYPEILPPSEGGTYFNNAVHVKLDNKNTAIRQCKDKEFIREMMYASPDTVNAFYTPTFNNINILAGILNSPVYDKNASRAQKLGSIGAVVGHEIGHAFDTTGSQYDELGRKVNWWTEKDAQKYSELVQHFVEYYSKFEVIDGVTQDSTITITENMADFAGLQCAMDAVGDDKEAQKEALEAWAKVWAQIGTEKYVTNSVLLTDVHSENNVRVDAVVASMDCFYDLYDVKEGDAMYVVPEDRLKLW